ncbi:energy transducer TonB [Agaribacter flavus]|uniref:Protein TonB n=1 Tax=Agaribacter flavus TaxID=1902781 RepID=A0ABV7FQT8_9ALTE
MSTLNTLNQNSPSFFQRIALLSTQSSIAFIITFALFIIMHELTDAEAEAPIRPSEYVNLTLVFEEPDEKTIVKQTLKPKPITTSPPTPILVPVEKTIPGEINPTLSLQKPIIRTNISPTIGATNSTLRPLFRTNPRYPTTAARDGIEGFVVLSFDINTAGEVENITIVDAKPKGMFERAARSALKKWKYQPQTKNGQPTAVSAMQVQLDFSLSD